jgi:hypothetical protein
LVCNEGSFVYDGGSVVCDGGGVVCDLSKFELNQTYFGTKKGASFWLETPGFAFERSFCSRLPWSDNPEAFPAQ